MEKVNKSYKIINVKNKKNYNRILGELRKIKELSDINLNKDQHMLHVGLLPTEETGVPQIEAKIQKALQRYEKTAGIEEFEDKESVRKVLILKGIDCGHCATRIENLARKLSATKSWWLILQPNVLSSKRRIWNSGKHFAGSNQAGSQD